MPGKTPPVTIHPYSSIDVIQEESLRSQDYADYSDGQRRSLPRYASDGGDGKRPGKTPFKKDDYGVPRRNEHRKANCKWDHDQNKNRLTGGQKQLPEASQFHEETKQYLS